MRWRAASGELKDSAHPRHISWGAQPVFHIAVWSHLDSDCSKSWTFSSPTPWENHHVTLRLAEVQYCWLQGNSLRHHARKSSSESVCLLRNRISWLSRPHVLSISVFLKDGQWSYWWLIWQHHHWKSIEQRWKSYLLLCQRRRHLSWHFLERTGSIAFQAMCSLSWYLFPPRWRSRIGTCVWPFLNCLLGWCLLTCQAKNNPRHWLHCWRLPRGASLGTDDTWGPRWLPSRSLTRFQCNSSFHQTYYRTVSLQRQLEHSRLWYCLRCQLWRASSHSQYPSCSQTGQSRQAVVQCVLWESRMALGSHQFRHTSFQFHSNSRVWPSNLQRPKPSCRGCSAWIVRHERCPYENEVCTFQRVPFASAQHLLRLRHLQCFCLKLQVLPQPWVLHRSHRFVNLSHF